MWDKTKLLQLAILLIVVFAVILFTVLIIVGHTNSFNFFYSYLIDEKLYAESVSLFRF